jgi:hypothetical protein
LYATGHFKIDNIITQFKAKRKIKKTLIH